MPCDFSSSGKISDVVNVVNMSKQIFFSVANDNVIRVCQFNAFQMRDAGQKLENVVINFDVQALDASDCDYADISPIGDLNGKLTNVTITGLI